MTTDKKRYEQKTKVVTFRVSNEIYDQIEDAKAKTGLSNADLIKLGAGIAQEEIKAKLAELSGLEIGGWLSSRWLYGKHSKSWIG